MCSDLPQHFLHSECQGQRISGVLILEKTLIFGFSRTDQDWLIKGVTWSGFESDSSYQYFLSTCFYLNILFYVCLHLIVIPHVTVNHLKTQTHMTYFWSQNLGIHPNQFLASTQAHTQIKRDFYPTIKRFQGKSLPFKLIPVSLNLFIPPSRETKAAVITCQAQMLKTSDQVDKRENTHAQSLPTQPGVPQAVDITSPLPSILDNPKSLIMILDSSS